MMQTWSHLKYLLRFIPQLISLSWSPSGDLPQVNVLPVFSVTRHSWLTGTGWGLDSTSANASTMHFITCRGRKVHGMSQKTFFAGTFSHEPDHHKRVDESVILLSAQILPRSDWINPHSFSFSLTAALAVNSKTLKKNKKPSDGRSESSQLPLCFSMLSQSHMPDDF